MKAFVLLSTCAFLALALGACNDVGDCPAASAITPGGSCSGDSLQCPYTLQSATDPATTCATSCTCTSGSWACPDPSLCAPEAGGDDGGGTGDDGGGE